jgi:hypothetical protein
MCQIGQSVSAFCLSHSFIGVHQCASVVPRLFRLLFGAIGGHFWLCFDAAERCDGHGLGILNKPNGVALPVSTSEA